MSKSLPRSDKLSEYARRIVTNELMIADPRDPDWRMSLMLIADGLADYDNLGTILVPLSPHMGGRWLNGRVPAVTVQAIPLAIEDMEELATKLDRMSKALRDV